MTPLINPKAQENPEWDEKCESSEIISLQLSHSLKITEFRICKYEYEQ